MTSVKSTRLGRFNMVERIDIYSRMRALIQRGDSNLSIARDLGISERTVMRYRVQHRLPNYYGRPTEGNAP